MAETMPIPEFTPDLSTIGINGAEIVSGVLAQADGYGPFRQFAAYALSALPAACRGYYFARRSDGSIAVFAGTSTRLYLFNNTTLAWTDVSKGGAAYTTLVSTEHWQFRQFNDLVLAVQSNTVPQEFTLSSSTTFNDLGGSPPQAAYIAIINRVIVLSGLLSNPRRIHWCDLDAPTVWTAGVGTADFQDLPDGGNAHAVIGSDQWGVVLQDEGVRQLVFVPGSPLTFNITRIMQDEPLFARYSGIAVGDRIFYCSAQGFKMVRPGGRPEPIGKERVDRYFFRNVDTGSLQLLIAASDPRATRVYWAYKSQSGQAGLFDKILIFDWSLTERGKWVEVPQMGEYLAALSRAGATLDSLTGSIDSMSTSFDTISTGSVPQLSAFNSAHMLGFYDGPNMEAIVETMEVDLEGKTVFVSGLRPITDAANVVMSLGHRLTAAGAVAYTTERALHSATGMAPCLKETRYARARARIPAGEAWTYIRGVQPESEIAGER